MVSERGTQASCLLIKSENDQGVKEVMLEVKYPGLIQPQRCPLWTAVLELEVVIKGKTKSCWPPINSGKY